MSYDAEDIAFGVQLFMTTSASATVAADRWEVDANDLGEVDIRTHNGQHFRLTVEEIEDED